MRPGRRGGTSHRGAVCLHAPDLGYVFTGDTLFNSAAARPVGSR
ncbi:hypothetical protein ABZZ80_18875 [Streptomyces sp. NPDC006356]